MGKNKYLYITLLCVLGIQQETLAQTLSSAPKLVVNVTIDQLRADYLETFIPLYRADGFRLLLGQGKVYTNASYNFAPVDRASAIATLATGTTPYYHGIVGTEWLSKPKLQTVNCISLTQGYKAAANLQTSTLGDELKLASEGLSLVYSFAPTADAAILSAGHAATAVAWVSGSRWAMLNYDQPLPEWMSTFTRQTGIATDVNQSIADMAIKCIEQASVGVDEQPDVLNVIFKQGATPRDTYISLDYNIARLINRLEARIGHSRYLLVVTGTGYSEEKDKPGSEERFHIPTGKFNIVRTSNLLNMYLGAIYAPAKYIETCYRNQLFLNLQLIERLNINLSELLKRSQDFLIQVEGVRNVYTSTQLMTSENSRLEKIRNGYCIDKCGDLMIEVAPGWKLVNEERNENIPQRTSFFSFPIIFYGSTLRKETIQTPVTVDRIAPTVAKAIRIRAPNACSSEPLF